MLKKLALRPVPELDSLRTISILLVVMFHQYPVGNAVYEWLKSYGWIGVDIFFVLSGYIITNLLLKEFSKSADIKLKRFWIKRAIRLWPSWSLMLMLYFAMIYVWLRKIPATEIAFKHNWWHYVCHFANYSNAYWGRIHTVISHFWSLSIEEHFYLVWPILLLLILKSKINKAFIFGFLLIIPYSIRILYASKGYDLNISYFSTETRFDELLMGCIWAYYSENIPKINYFVEIILTILMLVLFHLGLTLHGNNLFNYYISSLDYVLIGLGALILIYIATKGGKYGMKYFLKNEIMSKLGILSYGVYLVHPMISYFVHGFNHRFNFNLSVTSLLLINTIVPFFMAYALYIQVDQRFSKFKKGIAE